VLGTAPNTTAGVTFCEQPAAYLATLREHVSQHDPFRMTALHTLTALSGSALIALMHAAGRLDCTKAWAAAHIDEDWQMAQWGEDYEAHRRRERRFAEFAAASRFFALARNTGT
jgi:chaperone required for assembly of F1-ATPase